MKISWQLEILYFCQLYTWLWFRLLMETTCKILITGWQLGTEEVMALLKAGSRFHQRFVDCPAYSFMWGDDSAQDCGAVPGLSLEPDHSPVRVQSGSEWTMWDLTLPWSFHVGVVLPVEGTGWQMTWLGACQYKVKLVAKDKLELPEEIFTISWFFVTFLICSSRFFKLDSLYQQTTASALIPIFFFFGSVPSFFISLIFLQIWCGTWLHRCFIRHNEGLITAIRGEGMSGMASWKQTGRQKPPHCLCYQRMQDVGLRARICWSSSPGGLRGALSGCSLVLSSKYGLSFLLLFCVFLLVLQNISASLLIFLTDHD